MSTSRKVAIVSGGATLIGAAVVDALVRDGCAVAIADIDVAAARSVAAQAAGSVLAVETDLTSDASVAALVGTVCRELGGIDYVVNVACSYVDRGAESTRAEWLAGLNVNLVGAAMLVQAAYEQLKARRGAVVNFSSTSGYVAQAGRWVYPASKAAILQLTRSQALDFAADGVRVNSVSPGWIWSRVMNEMTGGNPDAINDVARNFHMLDRIGQPREVGEVVAFLCSDRASFITGSDFPVDGGYLGLGPEGRGEAVKALKP